MTAKEFAKRELAKKKKENPKAYERDGRYASPITNKKKKK